MTRVSAGQSYLLLLLLAALWLRTSGERRHGSCVATHLQQAGIPRLRAARYEVGLAQRRIPANDISSLPLTVLEVFGVNITADVIKLSECFSGRIPACASFQHCNGNGQCVLGVGHGSSGESRVYTCTCKAGFKGEECQTNACLEDGSTPTCQNGGRCIPLSTAPYHRCQCPEDFIGENCQSARDHCGPQNPCAHGGRCRSVTAGFTCNCARGYTGRKCEDHLLTKPKLDEYFAHQRTAIHSQFAQQDTRISKLEKAILNRLASLENRLLASDRKRAIPAGLRFFRDPSTWHAARYKCRDLGGILAVPRNAAEGRVISLLARQVREYAYSWIGASDLAQESRWKDLKGVTLTYTPWDRNEPGNNRGAEHCARFLVNGGRWHDDNCGRAFSFTCRFP
eukprot:scpid40673/ scgid32565/ Protein eyes shut; Protein spacemaker